MFVYEREKGLRKAWLLTVSVVEDNDASLLWLSLVRVNHGSANYEVHRWVFAQATRHHAEGILAGEELMGMENWHGDTNKE